MRQVTIMVLFALVAAVAFTTAPTAADESKKADAKPENKLIGTWKQVSAKYGGRDFKPPEGRTTLKHVTPTQFMWLSYDKDGNVTRAAGGRYTMKGVVYEETPEYGISGDFELIKGRAQTFKWKVEGNKWYHTGELSNGLTIQEVWERVEKQ
jgi:hypothetical protein